MSKMDLNKVVAGLKSDLPVPKNKFSSKKQVGPSKVKDSPKDLTLFFRKKYSQTFNVKINYEFLSKKDLKLMSLLMNEFEIKDLRIMMAWFIAYSHRLSGYKGVPTIQGLYGWRYDIQLQCKEYLDKEETEDGKSGARI